jgi:hypothetical protein
MVTGVTEFRSGAVAPGPKPAGLGCRLAVPNNAYFLSIYMRNHKTVGLIVSSDRRVSSAFNLLHLERIFLI